MMVHSSNISPLQALAAKWHMIALLAVAFARPMRRYEDGYKPGTYEFTRQLELAVRAWHALLMQDIQDASETAPPKTAEDEQALLHLRGIAVCLLAIVLVLSHVRQRVLGALCWRRERSSEPFNPASLVFPARIFSVPVRDSS